METQDLAAASRYVSRLEKEAARGRKISVKKLLLDKKFQEIKNLIVKEAAMGKKHPKLLTLINLLKDETRLAGKKVIVFANYRYTVKTISYYLQKNGVSCKWFVGQRNKLDVGLTRTEQSTCLEEFKKGEFQVLVSTSIGEEGIDIPECNAVVFYDMIPGLIRAFQRKGRTGRATVGEVIYLIAHGTIEEKYYWRYKKKENWFMLLKKKIPLIERALKEELQELVEKHYRREKTGISEKRAFDDPFLFDHDSSSIHVEDVPRDNDPTLRNNNVPDHDNKTKKLEQENPDLIVDVRETREQHVDILKKLGYEVGIEQLPTGDFLLPGDLIIERKEIYDFQESVIDGRLFEQATRMKSFKKQLFIVEGAVEQLRISRAAFNSAILSIMVDFSIPIIFTNDMKETCDVISLLIKRAKSRKDKMISIKNKVKFPRDDPFMAKVAFISALPGVNVKTATKLLEEFKSIKNITCASEKEFLKIRGIGKTLSSRLFNYFQRVN